MVFSAELSGLEGFGPVSCFGGFIFSPSTLLYFQECVLLAGRGRRMHIVLVSLALQ